jgi:hypothetical protein
MPKHSETSAFGRIAITMSIILDERAMRMVLTQLGERARE